MITLLYGVEEWASYAIADCKLFVGGKGGTLLPSDYSSFLRAYEC